MQESSPTQPFPPVPPLSEWEALFALCDTTLEEEFYEWDSTISDGLEKEAPFESV